MALLPALVPLLSIFTIAGELRKSVEATGAKVLDLGGAGRTDPGVHALAQVAHLCLDRVEQLADPYLRGYDGSPSDRYGVVLVEWTSLTDDLMGAPATGDVDEAMVEALIAAYAVGGSP